MVVWRKQQSEPTSDTVVRRWYHWFHPDDSPEERRVIVKLDLLIVIYAVIVYWVKYLDQANINNAYVSGMSEELNFHGNELVQFQTMYSVGAVVGQLPFALLFPKLRMNWLIPGLDIGWGIFTLLQYRATGYSEMMAYRFMVGLLESAFFPGVHYVLGAWYRGDEISRRGGFFYTGLYLGTLTAGLLQGAAFRNLDGVHGLSGWRWMFLINTIITIPVGLLGFILWPGTPDKASTLFLSKEEVALAKKRLERVGHSHDESMNWSAFQRIFTTWRIWVLIIWDVFFWLQCTHSSTGGYLLWLKSLHRYPTGEVNDLGTTAPALGIFYVLFICFGADLFLGRAGAITLSATWNFIGLVILTVWNVPESAKWFAFQTIYASNALSSVLYGWANDILRHSPQERSFALIAMNSIAQSTNCWVPLLVFKTVEAPRYPKGYPFVAASAICLIAMTWVVKWLHDRQERQIKAAAAAAAAADSSPGFEDNQIDNPDRINTSRDFDVKTVQANVKAQ